MSLKAIILRAEGALVDSDELQRLAMQSLVSEAGYDWPLGRAEMARLVPYTTREERLDRFVRENIRRTAEPSDLDGLIVAMQKRLASIIGEMLQAGRFVLRPATRDLVSSLRADGLRVALVSSSEPRELEWLLDGRSGLASSSFDVVVSEPGGKNAATRCYARALAQLDVAASDALAIEGTAAGLEAASAAGLRTIITRSIHCPAESVEEAAFVVDGLYELLSNSPYHGPDHLGPDDRLELVAALHRLHAGIIDLNGMADRSSDMKVSEILKTKGTVVKSISSGETIWALAQRLKTDSIGALVVLRADGTIEGIISERDIARGLAEHGSTLPGKTVADLMTRNVITCTPEDSVAGISRIMTQRRIRHLPVLDSGKVAGLISIGDVLSHRLDQMQKEVNILRDYVIAKS